MSYTKINGMKVGDGTYAAPGSKQSGQITWEVVPDFTAKKVEFRIDADNTNKDGIFTFSNGQKVWTENIAPYFANGDSGKIDTTKLSDGAHKLGARLYDSTGSYKGVATWISVDNSVVVPDPEPEPPAGDVFFIGDQLSNWPAPQQKASGRASDVTSPVHLKSKAIRFEVRPGDNNVAGSGAGERTEVMIGTDKTHGHKGNEIWCCFSACLDTPRSTKGWNTIVQFHHTGTTGQAPDMRAYKGGPMFIRVYPSGKQFTLTSQWVTDKWYEIVWGMYLDDDPAKGWTEAWLDGKQVLQRTNIATLYPGQGVYAKAGHYRGAWTEIDRTIIEGYCLATTKEAGIAHAFPGSTLWSSENPNPEPDPIPVPDPGQAPIWNGDLSTGDWSQWGGCEYVGTNKPGPPISDRVKVAANIDGFTAPGGLKNIMRMETRPGDQYMNSTGWRTIFRQYEPLRHIKDGYDSWYVFATLVPPGWPADASMWMCGLNIHQTKASYVSVTGVAPFHTIIHKDHFYVDSFGGRDGQKTTNFQKSFMQNYEQGKWYVWVVRYHHDYTNGDVEVYCSKVGTPIQLQAETHGKSTLYEGTDNFFEYGNYRKQTGTSSIKSYHAGAREYKNKADAMAWANKLLGV